MANKSAYPTIIAVCTAVLFAAVLFSLTLGSADISLKELSSAAVGRGEYAVVSVLLNVRIPRTARRRPRGKRAFSRGCCDPVGSRQSAGRPNIIGVNAGAGVSAVICAAFLPAATWIMPTAAFLGALIAMLLIYAVARLTGASRITLVLAGIAVGSILSACIDAIVTIVPEALVSVNAFRIGSISGTVLKKLYIPARISLPRSSCCFHSATIWMCWRWKTKPRPRLV